MARTYAKLKGSIWREDDWRALPASHQRLYMLLFSQPDISNCGVLPYLPGKWARMAADTTLHDVETIIADLQRDRFICVDEDSCELLIRTYVKHDQVAEQPKIRAAAVRQFDGIHSIRVRSALADEYPDVFHLRPHETAVPEPYGEPYAEGYGEGYAVPTRVRAQAATRQPPTVPVPSNHQPPAAPAPNDSAKNPAAAEALERLRAAGWSNGQLDAPDLDRAVAWLDHYQNDPTAKKPAALAWTKYSTVTTWPDTPRSEIARGATGTRSTSPPLPDKPRDPELKPAPPPDSFRKLAGRTTEPPAPPAQLDQPENA